MSNESEWTESDYLITHTAPRKIIRCLDYYPPDFHEDETLLDGRFRALYYDVERIGECFDQA